MSKKPFKTADEQVRILESRGILIPDKEEAAEFLLRENYYAVINGYKDAFLDKQETNIAGEDRYQKGMPFSYFQLIYAFDEALRRETLNALIKAENAMKTATVYAFCDVHREDDAYLDPLNYCRKSDYKPQARYTSGLIKLLSVLQGVRDNRHRKKYIEHYVRARKNLPLWVASKCLTFGNMSAFFDYQQQNVKTKTCVALARALGKDTVKQTQLSYSYHTLPDFRNICAHDERLYSTKVGKNDDKGFPELLRALQTVTPSKQFSEYVETVASLTKIAGASDSELLRRIYKGLGMSEEELLSWK